jgi:hypothetical protein
VAVVEDAHTHTHLSTLQQGDGRTSLRCFINMHKQTDLLGAEEGEGGERFTKTIKQRCYRVIYIYVYLRVCVCQLVC